MNADKRRTIERLLGEVAFPIAGVVDIKNRWEGDAFVIVLHTDRDPDPDMEEQASLLDTALLSRTDLTTLTGVVWVLPSGEEREITWPKPPSWLDLAKED